MYLKTFAILLTLSFSLGLSMAKSKHTPISEKNSEKSHRIKRGSSTPLQNESSNPQAELIHSVTEEGGIEKSNDPYQLPATLCTALHHPPVVFDGRELSGHVKEKNIGIVKSLQDCTKFCCEDTSCHIAILRGQQCSTVSCANPQDCQPSTQLYSNVTLVLTRNIPAYLWNIGIQNAQDSTSHLSSDGLTLGLRADALPTTPASSKLPILQRACELNLNDCPKNEVCQAFGGDRRKDGICQCIEGYSRSVETGVCEYLVDGSVSTAAATDSAVHYMSIVATPTPSSTVPTPAGAVPVTFSSIAVSNELNSSSASIVVTTTTPAVPQKLDVAVNNKTVLLPTGKEVYEQKVTLSAYVIGVCETCQYEWKVLKQPETGGEETATVIEPHSQTITLTHLLAGTYLFSVRVTEPSTSKDGPPLAVGSTVANLTVLKPAQTNKPPVAVIVPGKQTVTLPSSAVILDGSGSTDDITESSELEYKWEIIMKPLGYEIEKQTGQTLKLQNLLPGNYTIMLKVKDRGGLEGNATATVEVVQEKDYPPAANAGGDQIVYLPQTETVMNGSASSDDHGIVEWEWTKGPDDDGLAVDMQDTRKPLLRLSGLESGHYQFILTVVDASGQSDKSIANVYVHKPNAAELQANAGPDFVITLPNTSVVLNGSKSGGSSPDTQYSWAQLSGPNTAVFNPSAKEIAVNVTGLTRGVYLFQLAVYSKAAGKVSVDNVTVTVRQEKNLPPKANGGGDFSVTLPVSLVQVNGSASTDDVGIVKWQWERLPTSLAAGHVLGKSSTAPVLLLTGLVEGQYQWRLTVWDDQGLSSTDTVSFFVKSGAHQKDQVAVVLGAGVESVSASHMTNLMQALKLMLPSAVSLQMIDFSGLPYSGESSVIVLGHVNAELPSDRSNADMAVVPGVNLASILSAGVRTASSGSGQLLDFPIISIHTVICQNNCSGHGECDQVRRECICQSWWMESFIRRHFGDQTPNCDWSVVYVFVTSIALASLSVVCLWGLTIMFAKKRARRHRRMSQDAASVGWFWSRCYSKENSSATHKRRGGRYTLLDDDVVKARIRSSLLDSNSESESDADVLFDTRNSKRHKLPDKLKNGHAKLPHSKLRT